MSTLVERVRYNRVVRKLASIAGRGGDGRIADFAMTTEEALAAGASNTEFGRLFFAHEGRAIHKWTQYLPAYDEQFAPYRAGFPLPDGSTRPLRLLEIGVQHGGSLQLWRQFFGPDAIIFGVDVDPQVAAVDSPDLPVRIGSQDDPEFLRRVVAEMGGVDIVLDDGSHRAEHVRASFDVLFPLLSDGGLYAVEDLHTMYWPGFGGGYRRSTSFFEVLRTLVDDMHSWYHPEGEKLGVNAAAQVPRVSIYDSIAFIAKSAPSRPGVVRFGVDSF